MWLGGWRGNVGVLSVATDREDENGCMKMPERYSGRLFDGDCRFCSFFSVCMVGVIGGGFGVRT